MTPFDRFMFERGETALESMSPRELIAYAFVAGYADAERDILKHLQQEASECVGLESRDLGDDLLSIIVDVRCGAHRPK